MTTTDTAPWNPEVSTELPKFGIWFYLTLWIHDDDSFADIFIAPTSFKPSFMMRNGKSTRENWTVRTKKSRMAHETKENAH